MASSKVASLASRIVESNNPGGRSRNKSHDSDGEDDVDALFAELEEEIENDDNAVIRERARALLQREVEKVTQMREDQHGKYTEIMDEKEVLQASINEKSCVIHFYHNNFKRCEIMDKHLAKLAPKYFSTRFIRVFVENVPWLVERLGIKVLPCVMCFVNGISREKLIGFEELGNSDSFDTAVLELRLASCGVIKKPNDATAPIYKVASSRYAKDDDGEIFDL